MNAVPRESAGVSVAPLVSVVTVCFNSARTIERTLKSVINQDYPNLEYIIIDGGSTDGTLTTIDLYRDRITHVISEPDGGVYDAMNKGVRRATGDWVHILNSDDYYASRAALQTAVPLLDRRRTNYFQMWRQFEDGRRDLQDWTYRRWRLFVSAFLPHPGLIVSRDQYESVGLYDTRYRIAADHEMILRLTAKWPGLKHDLPLTVMQQGGYSEMNLIQALREFEAVTIRHGLPRPVAGLIYQLKRRWWRV
ncbi:MAG: glycosyl transferase [Acidithiobacillales bacterium SM23_46]|nr:MAG: glycosyl transferase [Acidithiobacillales bacterium SM23_46]